VIPRARVAIVVRTKDRPEFLNRALADIRSQTFRDIVIAVVNDGGVALEHDELIESAGVTSPDALTLINNPVSRGRWAAANQGIGATQSEFVVIHDDDDTWEPNFLERTSKFLDAPRHEGYGGVAVRSHIVRETLAGAEIIELSSEPFVETLEHVSLYGLLEANLFPPISYLYRRELHDDVGFYNESLRVLADWEFNLRVASRYDIGFLTEHLSNWHWREGGSEGAARNVTGRDWQYEEDRARLLSGLLRTDLSDGRLGLGYLVNLLFHNREQVLRETSAADSRVDNLAKHITAATEGVRSATEQLLAQERAALGELRGSVTELTSVVARPGFVERFATAVWSRTRRAERKAR
jgi:glycosyltransferase involved in cell wall biosynthesis